MMPIKEIERGRDDSNTDISKISRLYFISYQSRDSFLLIFWSNDNYFMKLLLCFDIYKGFRSFRWKDLFHNNLTISLYFTYFFQLHLCTKVKLVVGYYIWWSYVITKFLSFYKIVCTWRFTVFYYSYLLDRLKWMCICC